MKERVILKPSYYYTWIQGKQNLTVGAGICYGVCVILGKKLKSSELNTNYISIMNSLKNNCTRTLQSGISKQKSEQQYSRNRLEPPLPKETPIIILCNTSSSSGWCGRYSVFSYLNPFAWFGNHACLLWYNDQGTLIFDPNTGLSLWPKVNNPDYDSVMSMIDWGYRNISSPLPIYVWGFQSLYKII